MLTDNQHTALQQAVYDYLCVRGLTDAATALASSTSTINVPDPSTPPPASPTLLEKKWSSVLRLQKKVLDLESRLKVSGSSSSSSSHRPVSGRCLPTPEGQECKGHRSGGVTSVSVHPSHNTVASAGADGTVKIWDWEGDAGSEFLQTLKGHTASVQDVCYSTSGALLASCSADLSVKVWDVEMGYECVKTLRGHEHNVSRVRFLPPNDLQLISASRDETVKVRAAVEGRTRELQLGISWVSRLARSL